MADNKTQALAIANEKKEAVAFLASVAVSAEVKKVIPKYITAERMLRIVQTAVLRDDRLLKAAAHPMGKLSLLTAILKCAAAGLEPDGRNAHLVAYWNKDLGCYEVQAQFDWKGLVTVALRTGFEAVYPEVVCRNDLFKATILDGVKKLQHEPKWEDRGAPYLFYCVTMRDKVLDYEVMTMEETESIRKRSPAGDKGPWKTDTLEMRKKCPIRRMSKRWDLSPEQRQALFGDDDVFPAIANEPDKPATPLFNVRPELQGLPASNPELAVPIGTDKTEFDKLVASVEAKCAAYKLQPKVLTGFLYEMGNVTTAITEVREIPIDVLRMVDEQFVNMVERINGGHA